jgi:DNA polymerase
MTDRRDAVLAEIGIQPIWRLRAQTPAREAAPDKPLQPVAAQAPVIPVHTGRLLEEPSGASLSTMPPSKASSVQEALGWAALEESVRGCTACGLCQARKQTVFGVGDRQADWLLVGEGPGAEEDERGEPFVGQAGKLLDAMLGSIGLTRGEDVYIANAVKCRPPGNRTPEASEIAACTPFLERQIALIQPRLIVALGRPAAQSLLNAEIKIGAARGRLFDRQGIPVIVTYHPAYLLRNLEDKAKSWEDLCFAQDQMQRLKAGARGEIA